MDYSSGRSNKQYSYEQNLEFIKHFDKTKIKYNLKKLTKKLTYYSSKYKYIPAEVNKTDLFEYYSKIRQLDHIFGNLGGGGLEYSSRNELSDTTGFLS